MKDKSFIKGVFAGAVPAILVAVVFNMLMLSKESAKQTDIDEATSRKINTIAKLVDTKFLFDIDDRKLEDELCRGYMNGLDDKYSTYYTKEEMEQVTQSSQGTYAGIGVTISTDASTGYIKIVEVNENGPAKEAGIQTDDVIVGVDGVRITLDNSSEISDSILGAVDTYVTLTIQRGGNEFEKKIKRAYIEYNYVYYEMLDNQIAYIYISRFTSATIGQFKIAVDNMIKDGAKGVIFDVRSNPGGTLESVVEMVDYLLPEGMIMSVKDKNGKGKEYKSTGAEAKLNIPCVILTNEKSASASEVFSGALKDRGYAKTVGVKTFGKGIVQSLYTLSDGSAVKLTVENYYTPNDVCIHGIGISPDVEIELDNDKAAEGIDVQLDKAVEVIEQMF